ncbi:MAG: UbiX family flavin prenyltransferase [Spirochaetota bacterium]|nr:UbiX family flavin prenyltransferase [Spirochaetota bacterium]
MKITVGITGASGSILGVTLLKELLGAGVDVSLIVTDTAKKVCPYETGIEPGNLAKELGITEYDIHDLFAAPSSGSYLLDALVIIPCSMGTLSRVAQGNSGNLLERVADVQLKERRKLILCPRESPLNNIHLNNMLTLSQSGAIICPPAISFYSKPKTVEDIINFQVGKVLDLVSIRHDLFRRWGVV